MCCWLATRGRKIRGQHLDSVLPAPSSVAKLSEQSHCPDSFQDAVGHHVGAVGLPVHRTHRCRSERQCLGAALGAARTTAPVPLGHSCIGSSFPGCKAARPGASGRRMDPCLSLCSTGQGVAEARMLRAAESKLPALRDRWRQPSQIDWPCCSNPIGSSRVFPVMGHGRDPLGGFQNLWDVSPSPASRVASPTQQRNRNSGTTATFPIQQLSSCTSCRLSHQPNRSCEKKAQRGEGG